MPRQRIADASKSFFFAGPGQEGDFHLAEVVHRDPLAAAWFIQLIMLFSTCGSFIACVVSIAFLCKHWDHCSGCDRPLRWWLLVQVPLQAIQVPVRLVLFATVRSVQRARGDLQDAVRSLTGSSAWHASKTASLILYGWFILGFVWWMHSTRCETCPGITLLTVAVMTLSLARAVVTLVAFMFLFPPLEDHGHDVAEVGSKVEAATPCLVDSLAVVRFPSPPDQESWLDTGEPSCAVCLADFCGGDLLRRLPCRHHFHKSCIDKWLFRNKRCPLCMTAIDELVTATGTSKACQRKGWAMCD